MVLCYKLSINGTDYIDWIWKPLAWLSGSCLVGSLCLQMIHGGNGALTFLRSPVHPMNLHFVFVHLMILFSTGNGPNFSRQTLVGTVLILSAPTPLGFPKTWLSPVASNVTKSFICIKWIMAHSRRSTFFLNCCSSSKVHSASGLWLVNYPRTHFGLWRWSPIYWLYIVRGLWNSKFELYTNQ